MAVIEDLGLAVTITVDHSPATEYDDPQPLDDSNISERDTRCADKYIESIDGAHFSICCEVFEPQDWLWTHPGNALRFRIFIDGKRIATKLCVSSNVARRGNWTRFVDGFQKFNEDEDLGVLRKFQFKPIIPVEDADDFKTEEDEKKADSLGIIQVYVYREHVTGNGPVDYREKNIQEEHFALSEKALKGKAVSHGMSCGEAVSIPSRGGGSAIMAKGIDRYPIATFFFKYRSKEALQQELIIPRSRPASPEPDPFGFLWDDDSEHPTQADPMDAEYPQPRPRPVIKRGIGEVIDLTDESFERPHKLFKGDDLIDLTDD